MISARKRLQKWNVCEWFSITIIFGCNQQQSKQYYHFYIGIEKLLLIKLIKVDFKLIYKSKLAYYFRSRLDQNLIYFYIRVNRIIYLPISYFWPGRNISWWPEYKFQIDLYLTLLVSANSSLLIIVIHNDQLFLNSFLYFQNIFRK